MIATANVEVQGSEGAIEGSVDRPGSAANEGRADKVVRRSAEVGSANNVISSADEETPPPLAGGGWGEGAPSVHQSILSHARSMRRAPAPAERKLWQALRKRQAGQLKFRRQAPLGPYIADFYCSSAKLVVEVDGISHVDSPSDAIRDEWMRRRGLRIYRVTNFDVFSNLNGIVMAIEQAASAPPPPTPLPQGEGESPDALPSTTPHV